MHLADYPIVDGDLDHLVVDGSPIVDCLDVDCLDVGCLHV
jgi:hypothetical protein